MPKKLKGGSDIMDFDSMLNSQLGKMMGLTEKDRPKFEKRKKMKPKVKKPKKMSNGGSNNMKEKKDTLPLKGPIGRKVRENLDRIQESRERRKRSRKNKKTVPAFMKKGGEVQTEYRGGGAVNLGNFKGQF